MAGILTLMQFVKPLTDEDTIENSPLRFPSSEAAWEWLAEHGVPGFVCEAGRGHLACVVLDTPDGTGSSVWAYSGPENLVYLECW